MGISTLTWVVETNFNLAEQITGDIEGKHELFYR